MTTRVIATPEGFVDAESLQAHSIATAVAPPHPPMTTVHQGAVTFGAGDGATVHHGVSRYTVSHEGTHGGSVMATRQRVNGADTVELLPGVPGSRTHISHALRDGLVRQVAQGVYEDVKSSDGQQRSFATVEAEQHQAAEAQAREEARQVAEDTAGVFLPAEDAMWRDAMEAIPQQAFDSTMASVTNAIVLGQEFDTAARRLVGETGMEPAEALALIETAVELQSNIVGRALARVGISAGNLERFYMEECQSNPGRLQSALHHLTHGRDVSQFQAWGREWAEREGLRTLVAEGRNSTGPAVANQATAAPSDADHFKAAGFETRTTREGLMVRRGRGRWVSVAELMQG